MPLCAVMLLWAACASGFLLRGSSDAAAACSKVPEPPRHFKEITAASYDPEVAARAMWWSMVAAYGEYKLQKRKIGTGDLKNMVWLAGTNEVLVFRDPKTDDAYVIFRGTKTLTDVKRDLSVMTVSYRPRSESWGTSRLHAAASMLRPWQPRMHRGFAKRTDGHFAAILVALRKLFDDDLSTVKRIIFSGHSLGGAAAQGTAFLLTGWLETLHSKLEASKSGSSQTLGVPKGAGMSRGLEFEMTEGRLKMNGRSLNGMLKKDVKIEVYSFSAPRLGNWQLKMDYEKTVPSSFNHAFGSDLVPLVPPWEYEVGWQLRASPMSLAPLKLRSRLELLRPKKLVQTVTLMHMGVVQAFVGFFSQHDAGKMKSDIGWHDVTKGIAGLVEDQDEDREGSDEEQDAITTPRDERLECARAAHSSGEHGSEALKHGSEVQVKIKPPGFRIGHVAKRLFSFITDMAGLAVVPVAGLFLWHASWGVLNSLVPFQADYSRFTDYSQITRLFADVPRVIIGLTVPMLMIFCAEIWLSTR